MTRGSVAERCICAIRVAAWPSKFQPVRNHVDLRAIDRQVIRHEIGVVSIERDKRVDIRRPLAQVAAGFVVIRRRQLLQEQVLAR